MKIRLYNARILTMEKDRPVFFGEVHTEDDRITSVTAYPDVKSGPQEAGAFEEEIDCQGNLLMPGFKDAHTHSPMTFLRSYADDLPLQEWLQQKVFPMEEKLDDESIYQFGRLAVLEYLTSGITGIFDMYLRPEVMARVCVDMGMRCCLVSGLNDFTSSVERQEEEYLKLKKFHPLIKYQAGFHAEYTTSREMLEQLSQFVHRRHLPVFTHLAETAREVQECRERHGMTPAAFLEELGLFDYGGGGYHCVHMSEEDMQVFERRKLFAVTNPAANLKLASGIAPIAEFVKRGIPVAIGTDGPAGNNCLDVFREMFLVSGLAKVREGDAACMDAGAVLEMATVNGAKAMGFSDGDVLAPGKLADLIMIDLGQPNMQPIHNIPKNLVYSGSKSNVKMTMVGGRILFLDGKFFVNDTPERIYAECAKCLEKIMVR